MVLVSLYWLLFSFVEFKLIGFNFYEKDSF